MSERVPRVEPDESGHVWVQDGVEGWCVRCGTIIGCGQRQDGDMFPREGKPAEVCPGPEWAAGRVVELEAQLTRIGHERQIYDRVAMLLAGRPTNPAWEMAVAETLEIYDRIVSERRSQKNPQA